MCQLGMEIEQVQIPKKKPRKVYRWFEVQTNNKGVSKLSSLTGQGNQNTWNDGVIVKANKRPKLNTTTWAIDVVVFNTNGLYAYSTKKNALEDREDETHILGMIEIWGQCVKHEDGYRAEFAKIVALYPEASFDEVWNPKKCISETKCIENASSVQKALKENPKLKHVVYRKFRN